MTARQAFRDGRRRLGRLPRPRWWRVDDSPARLADLERRLKAADQRARSLSSSKEAMSALVADLLEVEVDSGASIENLVPYVRTLTKAAGFRGASATARRVLMRVEANGDHAAAVAIGLELARSVDRRYARLAHATALRCGDVRAAGAAAALAEGEPWMSSDLADCLAAERCLAVADVPGALSFLERSPRRRDVQYSRLYVRVLSSVGRFEDVLAHVRSADHGFNARSAALHEADALRWLDQDDAAGQIVAELAEDGLEDERVVRRVRDWGLAPDGGGEFANRLRTIEQRRESTDDVLASLLARYWESARPMTPHASSAALERDDTVLTDARPVTRLAPCSLPLLAPGLRPCDRVHRHTESIPATTGGGVPAGADPARNR